MFQIHLLTFNLQSTAQISSTCSQLTENHDLLSLQRRNPVDSRFWSRLCYYAVNYLDQTITISSQGKPLATWQLLLSQQQDFLDNHLARVPITPNQNGTKELRDEVLSSVGA